MSKRIVPLMGHPPWWREMCAVVGEVCGTIALNAAFVALVAAAWIYGYALGMTLSWHWWWEVIQHGR